MSNIPNLPIPIIVVEIETGDISTYYDIEELRNMVEEFWDILDNDFMFWDKNGYLIQFDKVFLDKKDEGGILTGNKDTHALKSYLLKYAEKKGVNLHKDAESMEIVDLCNEINRQPGSKGYRK